MVEDSMELFGLDAGCPAEVPPIISKPCLQLSKVDAVSRSSAQQLACFDYERAILKGIMHPIVRDTVDNVELDSEFPVCQESEPVDVQADGHLQLVMCGCRRRACQHSLVGQDEQLHAIACIVGRPRLEGIEIAAGNLDETASAVCQIAPLSQHVKMLYAWFHAGRTFPVHCDPMSIPVSQQVRDGGEQQNIATLDDERDACG